jgi:hypothetical protein
MLAAQVFEPAEVAGLDAVTQGLEHVLGWLGSLVTGRGEADPVDDAARIDRITLVERLQACLEAVKSVETVDFAKSQAAEQVSLGVHPARVGRGIADQVGLAGRVSPSEGSRRLHVARDVVLDMPVVLDLLTRGEINAGTARRIAEQVSHLDKATRRLVDAQLADQNLGGQSPRQAERRVTVRPAPDTMSLLSGLLPVEQGVACLAALEAEVTARKADGDERTKGQIMADTLVARITGQDHAEDTGFEVGIVLPVGSLLGPEDPTPAEIPGHGPIPAGLARELIANAQARCWWRRLFTRPTRTGGHLIVDLDQRRRRFTGWLAELIRWRDWTCRDPFCDAPIRHLDHIHRHTDGGPSNPVNGRGVCERGNYVREMPGWTVRLVDPGAHTVVTTTPTGHQYISNPPEPP